jgi:hypothetical protein
VADVQIMWSTTIILSDRATAGQARSADRAGSAGMANLTICRQARAGRLVYVSCPPATGRILVAERPIIVFDVNETLLDLEALRPVFDRIFSDPAAMRLWSAGAGAAGWQTALILREGNAPLDVGPQPDYIGKDLDAVADQLIERYAAASKAG